MFDASPFTAELSKPYESDLSMYNKFRPEGNCLGLVVANALLGQHHPGYDPDLLYSVLQIQSIVANTGNTLSKGDID